MKSSGLPKLPYGEGHMNWADEKHDFVYYRKSVSVGGKTKRIFVSAKTPSEAMKLMRKKQSEIEKALLVGIASEKNLTLSDGMRKWLDLFKAHEVNNRSFDRIESVFNTHIKESTIGNMREDSITSDDVQKFIINLKKHSRDGEILQNSSLAYSSRKKVYELLNQYFNNKYMDSPELNPMRKIPRPRRTDAEVLKTNEELIIWNDEEMNKLTEVAMMDYRIGIEGYKNGPLIAFLMWCFCRVGECLALQWKDIDFENETVTISKSYSRSKARTGDNIGKYEYKIVPTKTKCKRTVELCSRAMDAIKKYKEIKNPSSDDEYVCSTENGIMAVNSVTKTYESMVKFAELPEDKHVTVHGLRHSGISFFLRHGVSVEVVSRLAGHSSIDITQNTYYQILESQRKDALNELNAFLKSQKS